ncbi:hypothetical protein ZWY2020_059269, partial [Hordeum vulgare]
DFNELISRDTIIFDAPAGPYTMKVTKGWKITQIGDDKWDHFIARMHLTGQYDDPLDESFFAQRMTRLSEDETYMLWEKLPPRAAYVGMPFVTRLTRTMLLITV